MRFLKNRKFAAVVLAACVFASIFLLGGGALRNNRYDILRVFSDGTDTSLSTRHSMDAYLQRAAERANALAEQGVKLEAKESLVEAVRTYAQVVSTSHVALDERHLAYQNLTAAVESLYTQLERDNDEIDLLDAKLAYSDYKSAVNMIQNDQYPVLASEFNQSLKEFPANLIAAMFAIKPLNTFGW